MPDFILILFYLVFLSQIFVLSYYYPQKFYQRMRYVTENYPPSKYPKLYPKLSGPDADEAVKKWPRKYRLVNMLILLAGFILLGAALLFGYTPHGGGEEIIVVLYAALQFLPFIILEISEFKQSRLMRKENLATTRKADLQPRRFFDFISPVTFGAAVVILVAYVVYELYLHDFDVSGDSDLFYNLAVIAGLHIYFAVLIIWQVYGKKINPYQAGKDRRNDMKTIVKTMVYTSIAMSVLLITIAVIKEYNLDYLEPVIMSIYFQILAIFGLGTVLRTSRVESIDFDVYKEDISEA